MEKIFLCLALVSTTLGQELTHQQQSLQNSPRYTRQGYGSSPSKQPQTYPAIFPVKEPTPVYHPSKPEPGYGSQHTSIMEPVFIAPAYDIPGKDVQPVPSPVYENNYGGRKPQTYDLPVAHGNPSHHKVPITGGYDPTPPIEIETVGYNSKPNSHNLNNGKPNNGGYGSQLSHSGGHSNLNNGGYGSKIPHSGGYGGNSKPSTGGYGNPSHSMSGNYGHGEPPGSYGHNNGGYNKPPSNHGPNHGSSYGRPGGYGQQPLQNKPHKGSNGHIEESDGYGIGSSYGRPSYSTPGGGGYLTPPGAYKPATAGGYNAGTVGRPTSVIVSPSGSQHGINFGHNSPSNYGGGKKPNQPISSAYIR